MKNNGAETLVALLVIVVLFLVYVLTSSESRIVAEYGPDYCGKLGYHKVSSLDGKPACWRPIKMECKYEKCTNTEDEYYVIPREVIEWWKE